MNVNFYPPKVRLQHSKVQQTYLTTRAVRYEIFPMSYVMGIYVMI